MKIQLEASRRMPSIKENIEKAKKYKSLTQLIKERLPESVDNRRSRKTKH